MIKIKQVSLLVVSEYEFQASFPRLILTASKSLSCLHYLTGTLTSTDKLLEFAKLGCYCQFDLFGIECSLYQLHPSCDMPSDAQRLDKICQLIDDGRENEVLISHDIHTKHRLVSAIFRFITQFSLVNQIVSYLLVG